MALIYSGPLATNFNAGRGRTLAMASTGRLWAVVEDRPSSSTGKFWYSDNAGTSWTEATGLRIAGLRHGSLFIDVDDNMHVVSGDGSTTHYRRAVGGAVGTPPTGWHATVSNTGHNNSGASDVVAHRDPANAGQWIAHVVSSDTPGTGNKVLRYSRFRVSAAGVPTTLVEGLQVGTSTGFGSVGSLDFRHTGDGKTVSGTPDVFVAWSENNAATFFKKLTYSAGSWSVGSTRSLAGGGNTLGPQVVFDGTRAVIHSYTAADTAALVWERDAGDTTTTSRTPPATTGGAMTARALTIEPTTGDVFLFRVGASAQDPEFCKFTRAGASFSAWSVFAAAVTAADRSLSARRTAAGSNAVGTVFTDTFPNPDEHKFAVAVNLNVPPNAPAWVTSGGVKDVAVSLLLDWDFSDPDVGDAQSAYALSRQIGAGAVNYWRASDSSWQVAEVKNVSGTSAVTLAGGWGNDADASTVFKVKTWDVADEAGPYGPALTITPSAKDNPTISSPADLSTHTSATVTLVWSVATQTQYLARLLSTDGAVLATPAWVTSTATSHAFAYTLSDGVDYDLEVTTRNDEGLTSTKDTHRITVDFIEPAVPTVVLTVDGTAGTVAVAATHPTPSGGQPTVTSMDVWRRVTADGGDGVRLAAGAGPGSTVTDFTVASGVDYGFRVRAVGANGTTSWSVWAVA